MARILERSERLAPSPGAERVSQFGREMDEVRRCR